MTPMKEGPATLGGERGASGSRRISDGHDHRPTSLRAAIRRSRRQLSPAAALILTNDNFELCWRPCPDGTDRLGARVLTDICKGEVWPLEKLRQALEGWRVGRKHIVSWWLAQPDRREEEGFQ